MGFFNVRNILSNSRGPRIIHSQGRHQQVQLQIPHVVSGSVSQEFFVNNIQYSMIEDT